MKIRTFEKYPFDYAYTQINLGSIYISLANVRDKEQNLAKAIQTYEDALKIRTTEKYPFDYALIQSNLGNAYKSLSEVQDKEKNITNTILSYEEALKIFNNEKYPLYYKTVISLIDETKPFILVKTLILFQIISPEF